MADDFSEGFVAIFVRGARGQENWVDARIHLTVERRGGDDQEVTVAKLQPSEAASLGGMLIAAASALPNTADGLFEIYGSTDAYVNPAVVRA